jgi:hypothetical protein
MAAPNANAPTNANAPNANAITVGYVDPRLLSSDCMRIVPRD